MKLWMKIVFVFLLGLFVYFMISPILDHTVPYTYDQGRDFQKAMEMIEAKRPTFIGPTTGVMGLFHGAWWYYLLAIPGLLTKGLPIAYYYFMLILALAGNLWFFQFLRKKFNDLTALMFLAIITISPYFLKLGFTASNNILAPYFVMSLIVFTSMVFDKSKNKWLYLLIGLNLAFVLEFEVSFGLLLIPVFFVSALLFKEMREKIYSLGNLLSVIVGMTIPVLPRALFEIKNGFMQTKTLIGFFIKPKLHNPSPFPKVFSDRVTLFIEYVRGIAYDYSLYIAGAMVIFALVILIVRWKKNKQIVFTSYLLVLIAMLFGISLLYKDNFWFNYYEGIQYLFVAVFLIAFYLLSKWKVKLAYLALAIFLVMNLVGLVRHQASNKTQVIGLSEAEAVSDYINSKVGKNDYCLRIYTPPAIPHTHVYIMNWKSKTQGYKISTYNYRNNECFYIVEADPYKFRVTKWREENIPKEAKMVEKKDITKNVTVEKWVLK